MKGASSSVVAPCGTRPGRGGRATAWPPLGRARCPVAGATICFSAYQTGGRKLRLTLLFSLGTSVYKVDCLFSEGFGFKHSY